MLVKEVKKKVLVIRFNSIGDIVLTSPVIKALFDNGYEVHYLVKNAFAELVEENPFITKVWKLTDSLEEVIIMLNIERFDLIIDLHRNYRSTKVIRSLGVQTHRLKKPRIGYWLLTTFGINVIEEKHIVYRFMEVLAPLGITAQQPVTNFYFPDKLTLKKGLPENFLAIAIGAAWQTKEIPLEKLNDIIANTGWQNIVLLGSSADLAKSQALVSSNKNLINLVGKLTISQSALVVKQAKVLLSGDTGMMHIAAAVETAVVAVFGSTHPVLGYTPFTQENNYTLIQNNNLSCRPCTKQGRKACPKGHFRCILGLDYHQLVRKIDAFI